jgi:hypothetical protein
MLSTSPKKTIRTRPLRTPPPRLPSWTAALLLVLCCAWQGETRVPHYAAPFIPQVRAGREKTRKQANCAALAPNTSCHGGTKTEIGSKGGKMTATQCRDACQEHAEKKSGGA